MGRHRLIGEGGIASGRERDAALRLGAAAAVARAGERAPGNGRRARTLRHGDDTHADVGFPSPSRARPVDRFAARARSDRRSTERAQLDASRERLSHRRLTWDAGRRTARTFMSITRVERPHHTPVHRRDDHPARDHRWISRADRAARATGRAARASAGSPASNPRRRSNAQTADTGNILGRSRARSPGAVATARSTSGGFGRSGSSRRSRAATGSGTGPCSGASSTR